MGESKPTRLSAVLALVTLGFTAYMIVLAFSLVALTPRAPDRPGTSKQPTRSASPTAFTRTEAEAWLAPDCTRDEAWPKGKIPGSMVMRPVDPAHFDEIVRLPFDEAYRLALAGRAWTLAICEGPA